MASRRLPGSGGFALGATLRAVAIALLAFGAFLAGERHLWATALVLLAGLALVGLDLVRSTTAADRMLAQFVEGLTAEGHERPAPQPGLRLAAGAIERALDRLAATRADRQRRIDHLDALLDNVIAALLVVDEAGQVVSANRAARQNLGAAPGAIAAIAALPAATAVRLRTLPPGSREIVRLADGRSMLAQAASFVAEGRPLTLISLQSLSGELDAVELKAWQDLVRVLAHEMMNSLTPIASLSESLEQLLRSNPEASGAVEVIKRRSRGLMDFVERYRAIADLPPPRPQRVAVAALLSDIDRLLAPTFLEKHIECRACVEPLDTSVNADPQLLEQAVINLLRNAADAVRDSRPAHIDIACRAEAGFVSIEIADNGCGVAAANRDQVFVPFFTTKAGGSGIGLNLARQVALAHGGQLVFRTNEPQGSVFTLTLPAASAPALKSATRGQRWSSPATAAAAPAAAPRE
jgi:two-component system, NtrC family, nitrogen regulation sensor histidine kinase NtrY